MTSPMLTIGEVATRLAVSKDTVRALIATKGRRKLRAVKVGHQWRIDPSDLQDWIDQNATVSKPAA